MGVRAKDGGVSTLASSIGRTLGLASEENKFPMKIAMIKLATIIF